VPAGKRRREFAMLLLVGVAGAGAVLLATRQEAAHVVVTAPRPLPRTITPVSWQDLFPVVSALAVAALASMAAVLATRGWVRRVTGLITAALGVGIAALAAGRVTDGAVLAAVGHANLSPANGAGGGVAPGSTTAGGAGGATGSGSLAGFPAHVELAGTGWRALILAGAVLVVIVGVVTVIAATRLPAMSGKYERSGRSVTSPDTGPAVAGSQAAWSAETKPGVSGSPPKSARSRASTVRAGQAAGKARAAASMWESLSAGTDPTAQPGDETDLRAG
jgi:hypothetical protein